MATHGELECIICASPISPSTYDTHNSLNKTPLPVLPCGHIQCLPCLRRNFTISLRSLPFQPARCCGRDGIEPSLLRACLALSSRESHAYREKLAEHDARHKVYCFDPRCSAFIPEALRVGGRTARCRRCWARTCLRCGAKAHFGPCGELGEGGGTEIGVQGAVKGESKQRKAPSDDERFRRLSKEKGWKPCPNCKRWVEKTDGCNHIACLCGTHFCYRCGRAPYGNHGECAM